MERYTHLNAKIQRIARRDKKAFLSDQCKEIEALNSQLDEAKKEIDRSVELIQSQQKKKNFNEGSLIYLWDDIKQTNIHIIEIPEDKRRQKNLLK